VVAFGRAANGRLSDPRRISTRGDGQGVDFDTQGGLTLSADNRFLSACNPGSEDLTVFEVNGSRLKFVQKVSPEISPPASHSLAIWPTSSTAPSQERHHRLHRR